MPRRRFLVETDHSKSLNVGKSRGWVVGFLVLSSCWDVCGCNGLIGWVVWLCLARFDQGCVKGVGVAGMVET